MGKTRLFIGNLAASVNEDELRQKFQALVASGGNNARVGEVEVRCKNEGNCFGFVDVLDDSDFTEKQVLKEGVVPSQMSRVPPYLRKCIDLMNNTKWKGSLIKVQPAKENFLEKLKREQKTRTNEEAQMALIKENDVDPKSEQDRNKRHAESVLSKLGSGIGRRREKFGNSDSVQDNLRSRGQDQAERKADYDFEIVGKNSLKDKLISPKKDSPKKVKTSKRSREYSSDDSEEEIKDGIPKFKGLLLSYPDRNLPEIPNYKSTPEPVPSETSPKAVPKVKSREVSKEKSPKPRSKEKSPKPVTKEKSPESSTTNVQQKLLSIAFEKQQRLPHQIRSNAANGTISAPTPGVQFKKSKQQKSDLLRMQSLEKMKELNNQRKNIIKSSLSSTTPPVPVQKQHDETGNEAEPMTKKSKMTLFDEDSDSNGSAEDENEFKVKSQYEGATGQKLLELKTRYANDDRFKIDDRFKESEGPELEPAEQEKEKQMSILTDILGKSVLRENKSSSKTSTANKKDSVILPRYDPEADQGVLSDDDKQFEMEQPKKKSKIETLEATEAKKTVEVIRSNEPSTFKAVSNLKALFSSGENDQPQLKADSNNEPFSLLAAFGKSDEDDDRIERRTATKSTDLAGQAPRNFWQANPFKYDSSDDEDDNVKVTTGKTSKPAPISKFSVHEKPAFFFTSNDTRFKGLKDFFLKADEVIATDGDVESEKKQDDFSEKRQELKSIVKAKIRNTKRKDEKRTLAIKRAIRSRKKKQYESRKFAKY